MNKRIVKAKRMCPWGCCTNNATRRQQNHVIRQQAKKEWRKEWDM